MLKTPRCVIPFVIISLVLFSWYALKNHEYSTPEAQFRNEGTKSSEHEKFIQERLKEAESIWKRGIEVREAAEIESPINSDHPWTPVSYRTIWDFFYPNFNCPQNVERLGRLGDGGKWVCGVSHIAKYANPCIMYSYGISGDSSFEQDILNRTRCVVYAFDHTVEPDKVAITKDFPGRATFSKTGLGHEDTVNLKTLRTEMDQRGHKFIDILKVDIEGGEYLSIPRILKDFPDHLPFGQLLVELHLDFFPQKDLYQKLKSWWIPLEKAGLRAFRTEPNVFPNLMGSKYPSYYEISFININVDHVLLHANKNAK